MRNKPNPLKVTAVINDFNELYEEIVTKRKSVVIVYSLGQSRFLNIHYFGKTRAMPIYDLLKSGSIFKYDAKKDIKPKKLTS